jgi:hypothetical protein
VQQEAQNMLLCLYQASGAPVMDFALQLMGFCIAVDDGL